jgi:hypothetical protein
MPETKLEQLFTQVKEQTKQFKLNHPNGDGRAFWQPLKQLFADSGIQARSWKNQSLEELELIYRLAEYDTEGKIIEINHFLRQHARISKEEKPTLQRIMQIALNSGQFLATGHQFKEIKNFDYRNSGLDQLQTYLEEDEILEMSQKISDSLIEQVEGYFSSVVP